MKDDERIEELKDALRQTIETLEFFEKTSSYLRAELKKIINKKD